MLIAFVVGLVLGFVAGALVYRNNAKRLEREEVEARADYEAAISKLQAQIEKLKG